MRGNGVFYTPFFVFFSIFAENQHGSTMNNTQFKEDCERKLKEISKTIHGDEQLSVRDLHSLKEQQELLQTAIKIMTYGTGEERRRFRRDYERRVRQ